MSGRYLSARRKSYRTSCVDRMVNLRRENLLDKAKLDNMRFSPEITLSCFNMLDADDLARCSMVCREWESLSNTADLAKAVQ